MTKLDWRKAKRITGGTPAKKRRRKPGGGVKAWLRRMKRLERLRKAAG